MPHGSADNLACPHANRRASHGALSFGQGGEVFPDEEALVDGLEAGGRRPRAHFFFFASSYSFFMPATRYDAPLPFFGLPMDFKSAGTRGMISVCQAEYLVPPASESSRTRSVRH